MEGKSMTQVYGCGFINVTDYTVIEALLPEGMITYEGEGNGQTNGSKCKFDYAGRILFIAADNAPLSPTYGLPKWLVRATRVPGTPFDTITLGIDELPPINEDDELPIPNQLTVDNDGVVYFPGGPILTDGGQPVIIKAEITLEAGGVLSIDYTITEVGRGFLSTHCVTLDISHQYVATYATSPGLNGGDNIFDFTTEDMVYYDNIPAGQYIGEEPLNMETDTAEDSDNEGWSYVIVGCHPPAQGTIVSFLMPDFANGLAYTGCYALESVISVGALDGSLNVGMVYTMERYNRAPAANNVYTYAPQGLGGLTYTTSFAFNIPMNTPTHLDNRRDRNDDAWASVSISPETEDLGPPVLGGVQENKNGVDDNRQERDGYVAISTACRRERVVP
jgi:hypothetical protein